MDYDQTKMPSVYDAGREYSPSTERLWREAIINASKGNQIDRILDLGCGTGRYSAILSEGFDAKIIAIDPSRRMVAKAEEKELPGVTFKIGSAESIPLQDSNIDMVFMSMVLHHFSDRRAAVAECNRVLNSGGLICLRAGTVEQVSSYPYVPFFPSSRQNLESRLQTSTQIKDLFASGGFQNIEHRIVVSQIATTWAAFADRVSLRADSTLEQLSDNEFKLGLQTLRNYASEYRNNTPVIEPVDFFVFEKTS